MARRIRRWRKAVRFFLWSPYCLVCATQRIKGLYTRLLATGVLLFLLSGFCREQWNLDGSLGDGWSEVKTFWRGLLEFMDRAPWLIEILVCLLDVALFWFVAKGVALFVKSVPAYLEALVLLKINLRQGMIWSSNMQLNLLLSLPVTVILTLVARGTWSLLALGFALLTLWYLGVAINPNSLRRVMDYLNRYKIGWGDVGLPPEEDGELTPGDDEPDVPVR